MLNVVSGLKNFIVIFIKGVSYMLNKFLISIFILLFVASCTTTSKDTADSSGSGSSGEFNTETSSEGSSAAAGELTTVDYTSDDTGIVPGSQEDLIVNVGDRVFFDYDSFDLDADAQELLHDQAAWLKQYGNVNATVEGHCDERGTREYNLALGEKRAQAVKNYLVALGVSSSRLATISYGKERPAVIGSNDGAWSQNRRSVTIVN